MELKYLIVILVGIIFAIFVGIYLGTKGGILLNAFIGFVAGGIGTIIMFSLGTDRLKFIFTCVITMYISAILIYIVRLLCEGD